jgi:chemotaxis signal transduction protein
MADEKRYLILSMDGNGYAVPITGIVEITAPHDIERDGGLTEAFEGKFEFRDRRIPVLNLKKVLRLGGTGGTSLLVVRTAKGTIGMLVDAVTEIADIPGEPVPVPRGVLEPTLPYFRGILRHKNELVLLLNEDGLV